MNSRGLTLVEVLASAVLLAVMAGSCIPLMREVARLSGTDAESVVEDTAALRTALAGLSEEARSGLNEGPLALEGLDGGPVDLGLVSDSYAGTWLSCSWKTARVLLWQPAQDESEVQPAEVLP